MKKLNITKEQFNRSNYFQKKYGKLEYVSESGKLFKTNKGKVLKFNEGFMSNMGKDGQHLYSIIYKFDDWDGSVQEYGKTEEDAIQNAIAKGKIDDEDEIVKIVDLGEKGEYLESSRKLAKEAGRKVIPAANGCSIHDMGDCWIVTNKDGLNIGQCKTLIEAKHIAENADEYTAKKLGCAESKKLVKEGAGAGYDVGISNLEIDKVTEVKQLDDGDYAFTATIKPGFYEISAESYYDDFFWQEHEWGDKPEAQIDGGVIHGTICPWEDTDDPEEWVRYHVAGHTFNLSFMYGGGWMHVNLPEDGQLYIDKHIEITPDLYFSIDDIQLDAIDLVQAVNCGYASLDDRYEDEEDEGEEEGEDEPMNESSDKGWSLVGDYYVEFVQRLWEYTRKDMKNRRDAFSRCTNAMEKALREYYNEVVYDGAD